MRVITKTREKKDLHEKIGGHEGKMRGDNSQKSKRVKPLHKRK